MDIDGFILQFASHSNVDRHSSRRCFPLFPVGNKSENGWKLRADRSPVENLQQSPRTSKARSDKSTSPAADLDRASASAGKILRDLERREKSETSEDNVSYCQS